MPLAHRQTLEREIKLSLRRGFGGGASGDGIGLNDSGGELFEALGIAWDDGGRLSER